MNANKANLALLLAASLTAPATAQADSVVCRDATTFLAGTGDGFALAMVMTMATQGLRDADAAAVQDGRPSSTQDWSSEAMTGEALAVLVSCRQHPADTIGKRAAAVLRAYAIRHQAG